MIITVLCPHCIKVDLVEKMYMGQCRNCKAQVINIKDKKVEIFGRVGSSPNIIEKIDLENLIYTSSNPFGNNERCEKMISDGVKIGYKGRKIYGPHSTHFVLGISD